MITFPLLGTLNSIKWHIFSHSNTINKRFAFLKLNDSQKSVVFAVLFSFQFPLTSNYHKNTRLELLRLEQTSVERSNIKLLKMKNCSLILKLPMMFLKKFVPKATVKLRLAHRNLWNSQSCRHI